MNKNLLLLGIFITTVLSSCKFTFEESDYLGVYPGELKSNSSLYTDCNGQVTLTDVGENLVDLEIVTDSNGTFFYTDLLIERGHGFASNQLRIDREDVNVYINRNTNSIYLYHYDGGSYYTFTFNGKRQ